VKYQVEHIQWKDLLTVSERVPICAIESEPAIIDMVGYNIKEDDNIVCLAHMIYTIPKQTELIASEFSTVPKCSIIMRRKLFALDEIKADDPRLQEGWCGTFPKNKKEPK
jgi:hypothetical protein